MDLEAYAQAAAKAGRRCCICRLFDERPELALELRQARAKNRPRSFPVIAGYLRDEHRLQYDPTSIQKHFAEHER